MKLLRLWRGSPPQRPDLYRQDCYMTVISGKSCFTEQAWHNSLILPVYFGRSLAVSDRLWPSQALPRYEALLKEGLPEPQLTSNKCFWKGRGECFIQGLNYFIVLQCFPYVFLYFAQLAGPFWHFLLNNPHVFCWRSCCTARNNGLRVLLALVQRIVIREVCHQNAWS